MDWSTGACADTGKFVSNSAKRAVSAAATETAALDVWLSNFKSMELRLEVSFIQPGPRAAQLLG